MAVKGGAIARIAVVGADGFNRTDTDNDLVIRCCPWSDLAKLGNLADFDAVVLNLPDQVTRQQIDWTNVHAQLNLGSMRDVTKPGGLFVLLGDPRFDIVRNLPETDTSGTEPFLAWTGLQFFWDPRPGETKDFSADDYPAYRRLLDNLKSWSYSLRGCEVDETRWGELVHLAKLQSSGKHLVVKKETVASNRYEADLVFVTSVRTEDRASRTYIPDVRFGPIVFIPRPELSTDEAVGLILEDILNIPIALPEPTWVRDREAPGQTSIDEELGRLNNVLETNIRELKDATQKKAAIRRPLKLLYEGGTSLEAVVREVLEALGAVVEAPKEAGKEDGWIQVNIDGKDFGGVLEVKSTRKETFNEDGLRQLTEWVRRGIQERQVRLKGIFIGNSAITTPPDGRTSPFSDSWAKSAQLHGYVALTTSDLYSAYCKHRANALDTQLYWRTLFRTQGIMRSVPSE